MRVGWGIVVVALSLLCWGGQLLSWLAPDQAGRLGLIESEREVEVTFWADLRAEAIWDSFSLWVMVVAGALLIGDHQAWPVFGLVGGGMFVYFAGRGIAARLVMGRRGLRIGSDASVRVGLSFLALWGAMALVTIAAAWTELDL